MTINKVCSARATPGHALLIPVGLSDFGQLKDSQRTADQNQTLSSEDLAADCRQDTVPA